MKRARFEVWESLLWGSSNGVDYESKSLGWNWRLRAANGRIVCSASGFNTKAGAKRAARRVPYILKGWGRTIPTIEVAE